MWTVRIIHRVDKNKPVKCTVRHIVRIAELEQTVADAVRIDQVEIIELEHNNG